MNLRNIDARQFLPMVSSFIDGNIDKDLLTQATIDVPFIEEILHVFTRAQNDDAPEKVLNDLRAVLSTTLALYAMENQ